MSNLFWAVFLGSTSATVLVHLWITLVDEYRVRVRKKDLTLLLEQLEDSEFEEDEEE